MAIILADVIKFEKQTLAEIKTGLIKQGQMGFSKVDRIMTYRMADGSGYIDFPDTLALDAVIAQIEELEGATMKLTQMDETLPVTELMFDFDIVTPSDNTSLLDANATTNIVSFAEVKRLLRLELEIAQATEKFIAET